MFGSGVVELTVAVFVRVLPAGALGDRCTTS
jgi:hypothetical protein